MARRNYIDNLRWLSILLLFPVHTAMIYNDFGENFYIRGPVIPAVSAFIIATYSWFMPLLFVLAGISASFALEKRTTKEFAKERFFKLLVPFISGVLLIVPIQTYFAERFHNGYTGGYFRQYILFFTKKTDLTGYTGGFTPAHLWFILYLFIISLIALPIMAMYHKSLRKINTAKLSMPLIIAMFVIPLIMALVLDIGGKSLGEYFALFMLGFFILSCDEVINRMERYRWPLLAAAVMFTVITVVFHFNKILYSGISADVLQRLTGWVSILAFLGIVKHYFDFRTKATAYLAKGSFPIYVFHQSVLVVAAYYVFQISSVPAVQIPLILIITVAVTFAVYELFRRIGAMRFLFGIKA